MGLIATVTANGEYFFQTFINSLIYSPAATLPEDTIRAFADEVVYIGGDPLYWVRREAAFAVGALAKVVPMEVLLLSLLPLFEILSNDSTWHVRHSTVFALPGILARLPFDRRRSLALDTLSRLSQDESQTVRSGALEVLGEVIYTFHEDAQAVPVELVNLFIGQQAAFSPERYERSMGADHWPQKEPDASTVKKPLDMDVDDSVNQVADDTPEGRTLSSGTTVTTASTSSDEKEDPTRPLITSFNFPAVALSLGPGRWNEVREYFFALARDSNVRVRRTIAAGLGEMARILGSQLAQRDLFEIWEDKVHDAEDGQTRLKALSGLTMFVEALTGSTRAKVYDTLLELWGQWLTGWRERECLAGALPDLAKLAEGKGEVVRILMGKALLDNVAAVRERAVDAVSLCVHRNYKNSQKAEIIS